MRITLVAGFVLAAGGAVAMGVGTVFLLRVQDPPFHSVTRVLWMGSLFVLSGLAAIIIPAGVVVVRDFRRLNGVERHRPQPTSAEPSVQTGSPDRACGD